MELKELISKVEEYEKQTFILAKMATDLRILIVGLYDQIDYWKEQCMDCISKNPDDIRG